MRDSPVQQMGIAVSQSHRRVLRGDQLLRQGRQASITTRARRAAWRLAPPAPRRFRPSGWPPVLSLDVMAIRWSTGCYDTIKLYFDDYSGFCLLT